VVAIALMLSSSSIVVCADESRGQLAPLRSESMPAWRAIQYSHPTLAKCVVPAVPSCTPLRGHRVAVCREQLSYQRSGHGQHRQSERAPRFVLCGNVGFENCQFEIEDIPKKVFWYESETAPARLSIVIAV
jgi:hypothetical protein